MPTTEELTKLYTECGGDLQKVADHLGLPYAEFASKFGADLAPPATPPARRRPPPSDLGAALPPNRKFIVAFRHADNPLWPRDSQRKIDQARLDYEAGTHEMCQGRDRDWFVLYSIPRKQRTGARKFFQQY